MKEAEAAFAGHFMSPPPEIVEELNALRAKMAALIAANMKDHPLPDSEHYSLEETVAVNADGALIAMIILQSVRDASDQETAAMRGTLTPAQGLAQAVARVAPDAMACLGMIGSIANAAIPLAIQTIDGRDAAKASGDLSMMDSAGNA